MEQIGSILERTFREVATKREQNLKLVGANTAGDSPEDLAELIRVTQDNINRQIDAARERIYRQYGEVSNYDIWQVLKTEREAEYCKNCAGLPCIKPNNKTFIQKAAYNSNSQNISIMFGYCKYELARLRQVKLEKKYGLSKIPREYIGKTFDDYSVDAENARAVNAAKNLVELPTQGAYFYGNVGTGKTFLVSIIAQEIIKAGRTVIFTTVPAISMKIRNAFNNSATLSEIEFLEKLYTSDTLILDDIGIEKPTRFICSTLGNIFNERYNARRQTILTSNYTLKELEKIFNNPLDSPPTLDGTRIYDRCKQMCQPFELGGFSRRI